MTDKKTLMTMDNEDMKNGSTGAFPMADNTYYEPEYGLTKREHLAGLLRGNSVSVEVEE